MDPEKLKGSKGGGFNLGVQLGDIVGNPLAYFPNEMFQISKIRTEPVIQPMSFKDRVELFIYFIRYPFPDYWVWDRMKRTIMRYISDMSAMSNQAWYHRINDDLNYSITALPDAGQDQATTAGLYQFGTALFETLKRYIMAIHQFVGATMNAQLWANMGGFPIAERMWNELKRTTVQGWVQQLDEFPISSAIYNYLLGQQRVLKFQPSAGVLAYAYPVYLYEWQTHPESRSGTTPSREDIMPSLFEFVNVTPGDYYKDQLDTYGYGNSYIAGNFSRAIIRSRDYLLQSLGWNSNMIKIGTKLRDLMTKIGVFDKAFNYKQLVDDINQLPLYDGWDFVKKVMPFADKPRPILKHGEDLAYTVTHAEDSVIEDHPLDYILSAPGTLNAAGVLADHYEYLKIAQNAATFGDVINSLDWSVSADVAISTDDIRSVGMEVVGADLIEKVLKDWYKPYKDFWVAKVDDLYPDEYAETGKQYIVQDEYMQGLFMPRYLITPTIDVMDPVSCGFWKVLQYEWATADDWSIWANSYADDQGTTEWASHKADLVDSYFFVGAGFLSSPEVAHHNYLAAKASWRGTQEDDSSSGDHSGHGPSSLQYIPFIKSWWWNSVAFTSTNWNDTTSLWAAGGQTDYDFDSTVTSATRRSLWLALEHYDPNRPNQVRLSGWLLAQMQAFPEIIKNATDDWSQVFQNVPVNTVPVDKSDERYLSSYKILAINKPPLQSGKSAGQTRRSKGASRPKRTDRNPIGSLNDALVAIVEGGSISAIVNDTLAYLKSNFTYDYIKKQDPGVIAAAQEIANKYIGLLKTADDQRKSELAQELRKKLVADFTKSISAIKKRPENRGMPEEP